MEFSENNIEIAKAIVGAQAKFSKAAKDSNNPFFHSKYADLASNIDACSDGLAEFGLAFMHDTRTEYSVEDNPGYSENWEPKTDKDKKGLQPPPKMYVAKIHVQMILLHKSGEMVKSEPLTAVTRDASAQGIGSVITYLRRYSLSSFLGLAAEDDDGNAGSGRNQNNGNQNNGNYGNQQYPRNDGPSEDEKKAGRKVRGWLNQMLLKDTTMDEFKTHMDVFDKAHPGKRKTLTFHNDSETFQILAGQHYQRIERTEPKDSKSQNQEAFDSMIKTAEDKASFGTVEELFFGNEDLQNPENTKFINEKGFELGIEGYEEPEK